MKFSLQVVTVAIMVAFPSCDMREARGKSFDKDRWIQVALGTPLPSGISDLQGIGDTWQGFWCHFRLKIAPENLQQYLHANGYEEEEPGNVTRYFTIDPRFEKYFSPKWSPDLGPGSKVYIRHPSDYITCVLVHPDSDSVYVWTGSSHSPGPPPSNKVAAQATPPDASQPPTAGQPH